MGPRLWDPGPWDPGIWEPPQGLKVRPGTVPRFKFGTLGLPHPSKVKKGPPSKFKSGTPETSLNVRNRNSRNIPSFFIIVLLLIILKLVATLYSQILTHVLPNLRFNPLSANFTKWSNTLKQFVGKLPTYCLSVFDHFVGLTLKGLNSMFLK